MDWATAREYLHLAYTKTAKFTLYQSMVLYIIGCIAAGRLLGLPSFAAFLYRIFTFH